MVDTAAHRMVGLQWAYKWEKGHSGFLLIVKIKFYMKKWFSIQIQCATAVTSFAVSLVTGSMYNTVKNCIKCIVFLTLQNLCFISDLYFSRPQRLRIDKWRKWQEIQKNQEKHQRRKYACFLQFLWSIDWNHTGCWRDLLYNVANSEFSVRLQFTGDFLN